jgi:FkbM family methyltransferase
MLKYIKRVAGTALWHFTGHVREATSSDTDVIHKFAAFDGSGTPGFITDFLGIRTQVAFVQAAADKNGCVEGYPIPANFHASACEWASVLRAVLDSPKRQKMVVVEVGAGWGPWLVASHAAASQLGVKDIALVGLEGSSGHVEFMRQHFFDNGIDPARHRLIHGAAATMDGEVDFPEEDDPARDYGASIASSDALRSIAPSTHDVRIKAYSLPTLIAPYPIVDLLHIDVQGLEAELIAASLGMLGNKVRRIVIGTHGRDIEHRLMTEFSTKGWLLEADEACQYHQQAGKLDLVLDGCQAWLNPAI